MWFLTLSGSPVAQAEELRDPFMFGPRKVFSSPTTTTLPVLTGILWDAKSPLAVIDGEPATVGQDVGGWQVVEILPDKVVIQRDSERRTLIPGSSLPADD
jgi:hypothetical protein